jgi:hypothetical protein
MKGPIDRRCITMGELENLLSISSFLFYRFFFLLNDRNDMSCAFCVALTIGWAAGTDCA